jgi:hypothetical protein
MDNAGVAMELDFGGNLAKTRVKRIGNFERRSLLLSLLARVPVSKKLLQFDPERNR